MRATTGDRLLLGTALVTALASFAWVGAVDRRHRDSAAKPEPTADYVPAALGPPPAGPGKWHLPRAQTRGPGWVYDVFTPPEIDYDEQTREFTVTSLKG